MNAPRNGSQAIELSALDGTNPLGFLAALGTLVVARAAGESAARLRWRRSRTWTPVLEGFMAEDSAQLCERLAADLRGKDVFADVGMRRDAATRAYQQAKTAVKKELDRIRGAKLRGHERKEALEARVSPLEHQAAEKRREWLIALKGAVPRPELALGTRIDCTAGEYRQHAREFIDGSDQGSRDMLDLIAAFGSDACLEDDKGGRNERKIEATLFVYDE